MGTRLYSTAGCASTAKSTFAMPCDDDVGTAAKLSASCGWQLVECAQPRTLHLVSAAARRVRAKPSVGCSFYSTDYAVRAVAHATVMYLYIYIQRVRVSTRNRRASCLPSSSRRDDTYIYGVLYTPAIYIPPVVIYIYGYPHRCQRLSVYIHTACSTYVCRSTSPCIYTASWDTCVT